MLQKLSRFKKGTLIFAGIILVLILISAFLNSLANNESGKVFGVNSTGGLGLFAPPVSAVASGPPTPLSTDQIGFFAYYQLASGWSLSNSVPAFVSYTDGGNYYDGIVRVWDSGNIGSTSLDTSDSSTDVHVRIRSDGWIMAWFNRLTDDPASIVYWSHTRSHEGNPPTYSTTLSRAIEIVFKVENVGFPSYNSIGLYDYSQPSATRLFIFGYSSWDAYNGVTYYYTIPSSSALTPIRLLIRTGGDANGQTYPGTGIVSLSVDGGQVFSKDLGNTLWGWSTYELSAQQYLTKNVQHSVTQVSHFHENVAFLMWTG